jgi:hypothetical protein
MLTGIQTQMGAGRVQMAGDGTQLLTLGFKVATNLWRLGFNRPMPTI